MNDQPAEPAGAAVPAMTGAPREIAIRIGSGVALAMVAGGFVYAGGLAFAMGVAAVAAVTSFEWSRLVRGETYDLGLALQILGVVIAAVLAWVGLAGLGVAVVVAGTILTGLVCFQNRPLLSAEGVLYAGLPAIALIWLREDQPNGLMAVFFVLAAVAATDVAAFVFGRLIGGPKLAPAISPNKTWSGFLGGVATAGAVAVAFSTGIGGNAVMLGTAGIILGLLSQIGDLTESALKRSFGVKDTGAIIPGHGGMMDRIDGLVFASVAAGFFAFALNPQAPATALLFGG